MHHPCNQFSCPEYNQGQCFGGGCRINPAPSGDGDSETDDNEEEGSAG